MEATRKTDEISEAEYNKYHTNALAADDEKNGLANFTGYFVEKNNVTRTNVLADDKLSEKITTAIEGDQDKLGKGGYFSTGDIPLGKDVVSYKVQVFAENEKRVGVNNQSPRLQYNLPILADFSVIQDTVEPSKEVAKRILTKLKEQGKITEDQEKKIKEEIDKSKKTSEVRAAMSGDVTVRYVDTDGNNLPITDADAKKAGEKTDNGYLVRKDVLIGTDYDVNSKKVPYFNATNGKYYALRSVGRGLETSSDAPNGSITKKHTVITFVYEERTTPPTGKGVVHFKKQTSETETEALTGYDDITLEGDVGTEFSSESVNAKITALKNAGYEIVGDTFTSGDKTVDTIEDTEGQIPSQEYTITVKEKVVTVTEPPTPNTPVDPNVPEGPKWPTTGLAKSDLEKEVTRTINYVDEAGNKVSEPSTDKVTFTREAKINVVTGEITYGEWKAVGGDSTFDKVSSPVVNGYILKDPTQKEVAERKGITPTVANQTVEVVYKKLGSWIPKVPGEETPTPLPYPNNPTDPTKPGDPTDPNTPNVPVIPYVPGYTPKIGETPLQPKVPNDPTQGYIPPAVPTEPGKDTPIEYVKVPNTPSPEEPVKPTPESNHITIWVDENGKPLKPEKPGTHEPGNIPGYRLITTVTKDGVTIHKFEKITPVEPNNPVPQKPTTPIPTSQDPTIPTPESQIPTPNTPEANTPTSETNRREELPNTGTEANATLASVGIMTLLAGLGLGFFKKKEEDEK